jgi:Putative zinc-finger
VKTRFDQHAKFRDLLAARLDRQLTHAENRLLVGHLRTCPECRQAERDYLDQRSLLRALPRPMPPRDMWARTSTALDREVARWSYRYPRFGRPRVPTGDERARGTAPNALATAVAAIGIVTVLAVLQLSPANRTLPVPDGAEGTGGPRGAVATAGVNGARPTPFSVAAQPPLILVSGGDDLTVYRTDLVQMCPQDAYDCLVNEGITRQSIPFAERVQPENVALSPNGSEMAFVGSNDDKDVIAVVMLGRNGGGGARSPDPEQVPDGPPEESVAPNATPKRPTPEPTPPATPPASRLPSPTPRATPHGSDAPATDDPRTPRPDESSRPPRETPDTSETPAPSPTAEPDPTATGTPEETPSPPLIASPPSSAVPGLAVLSILEDVHSAGSPPAWSRDGAVLAFSAMPADGRHGPDVYVWRPGDERATPITSDHASYFASWSGRRIVFSRLLGEGTRDSLEIATVVIDPQTLDERTVDGPQMWLPIVDAQRMNAIAWYGQLGRRNGQPVLRSGALYVVDWAALNPFRIVQPGEQPGSEVEMVPLEPQRDPQEKPVVDWTVRWSTDGRVIGVWEGETTNAPWGQLELFAFDRTEGRLGERLIDPQLARRGFALGIDRVAWVGSSGDGADDELRVRTWGSDGVGGLRIRTIDVDEVVPAF